MTLDFAQDLVEALDKEKRNYVIILSDPEIDDYRIYYRYDHDEFMEKCSSLILHTLAEENAEENDNED
jgi:hypothetical protein